RKALTRQGGAEKGALLPAAQDPKKGGLCRQNRPEEEEIQVVAPAHQQCAVLRAGEIPGGEMGEVPAEDRLRPWKPLLPGGVRPVIHHSEGKGHPGQQVGRLHRNMAPGPRGAEPVRSATAAKARPCPWASRWTALRSSA